MLKMRRIKAPKRIIDHIFALCGRKYPDLEIWELYEEIPIQSKIHKFWADNFSAMFSPRKDSPPQYID